MGDQYYFVLKKFIQNRDRITNTKPTETVNVIRNLQYKQGKRVVSNQNEVNQNVPPSDIELEKIQRGADNFAGSLEYLMHDNLPMSRQDQYYAHEGPFFITFGIRPQKDIYTKEKCLSAVCPCNLH